MRLIDIHVKAAVPLVLVHLCAVGRARLLKKGYVWCGGVLFDDLLERRGGTSRDWA